MTTNGTPTVKRSLDLDLYAPGGLAALFDRNRLLYGDLRMVVGIDAATANADLNRFRNVAAAAIATPFIQLHIGDPGAAGTANVSVGCTTRNAITWNAPAAGSMTLLSLAAFTNTGATETISHVTIFSASTAGTFHHSFALSVAQAWVNTNTLTLSTFTLSRTPIAA